MCKIGGGDTVTVQSRGEDMKWSVRICWSDFLDVGDKREELISDILNQDMEHMGEVKWV